VLCIRNAEIRTMADVSYERGVILIENGKIREIGESVNVPAEAKVVDAGGKLVTPGLIDVHTHLGVLELGVGPAGSDVNELTDPATPHVRAIDGINPLDQGFQDAYRSGVTTVQVMPGSGNVIGGEMVVLKTFGKIVDQMVLRHPSALKIAFGENPKQIYGSKNKMPSTRMGLAAILREQFVKAQNYLRKKEMAERHPDQLFERDIKMETLAKALKKEIQVRAHAHRADDIVTAIRIAREFDLDLTIEHCTEGHKIAEYIKESGYRVSVGPTMSSRSKVELGDKGWHTLISLAEQDVPFSITTDHPVIPIDYLITSAAIAVANGLDEEKAWQALTIRAAEHIGVAERVGTLETGKDADLVIWSQNPLRYHGGQVDMTMLDGQVIYQR
jgi:imidazolonepropionase-like amidohydrolase